MIGDWVIIDTETTGISQPIYVVEIAAQRMQGFKRHGEPFRKLINHKTEIPSEASRVHGYTKEILERDGDDPLRVYKDLREYIGNRPISAYNLSYDWDEVLLPEWDRLGIPQIGKRGFCSYHLTRRLLDPSPAGNFKLQTLRQFYRLPERGAHTALGDVDTVIDLFNAVLKTRIEEEGLDSLSKVVTYATENWYPTLIPFGKYKGRDYRDAEQDPELKKWLNWLAESDNERSSNLGNWYLQKLSKPLEDQKSKKETENFTKLSDREYAVLKKRFGIELDVEEIEKLEHEELQQTVDAYRSQLGSLNSTIMAEKSELSSTQGKLFELTKDHYRKRDQLLITIKYRKRFLDILLIEGEEEAEKAVDEFQEAETSKDREYADAASSNDKKSLSEEDQKELKEIWKKLVRVYHPDTINTEPEKQKTYENLSSTINKAKEEQNISLLREISEDTNLFIMKQGWDPVDIDHDQQANLERLAESLRNEIDTKNIELEALRNSSEYEIMIFCRSNPQRLEEIANRQIQALQDEIGKLQNEADRLGKEIVELTNQSLKII